jgi:hypothetical protein
VADLTQTLFVVLFFGVVGYFVFRMIRHGGFKGGLFGARVERTVGEVSGEDQGPMIMVVKVHVLRRDPLEKLVGIELVAKSFANYQMMPVALSMVQAQRLASLLNDASRAP